MGNEEPRPSVREESFVIGERYQPHSSAGEDSSIVIGEREIPGVTDNRMMMMMDTNLPVIGIGSGKKIQPRIRRRTEEAGQEGEVDLIVTENIQIFPLKK